MTIIDRRGMQLLELVISLTSASVLMIGLSSSILIANQSMKLATTRHTAASKTQAGLDRLRYDLAESFRAADRTATSVTLSVADRNGDGVRELVQYRWLGSPGTPLERAVNTGAWTPVTENLSSFQMAWGTSPPQRSSGATLDPPGACVYQTSTTAFGLTSSSLSIPLPETYRTGDLLVAAIAVSGKGLNASVPPEWQEGPQQRIAGITLITFYSLASGTNSLHVSWSGKRSSSAVIAHFTTPGGSAVLVDGQVQSGTSPSPAAPSATATANNSLVLRLLAGKGLPVQDEACNMPDHLTVALRRDSAVDPMVGMTYRYYGPGNVPPAVFRLSSSADYVTATLVFQP